MLSLETVINQPFSVPFVARNNDSGRTNFTLTILKDGVVYTSLQSPLTWAEIGNGLYTLSLVFTDSGLYTFFIDNAIAASVWVKERSDLSFLQNIEDAAIGSWSWNKQTGVLTLYRVNGQVLQTFTMTDTVQLTQRERT